MSVKHLYLVAVAAIIGCAPASGTSGTSRTAAVPRKGNLLTAEEIAAAHADVTTAYDAVARLRPNWLAPRGTTGEASLLRPLRKSTAPAPTLADAAPGPAT
jgi:hypothetical protein